MAFDIVIENGLIIDGTKTKRYAADVGIKDDRIAEIGDLGSADAAERIDARGKSVAPGFVDVHNHSDGWLLKTPHIVSKTMQGFTTEVIMADGISYAPVNADTVHEWIYYLRGLNALRLEEYSGWQTLAEYMDLLDGKTAQNVLTHVPYANVRTMACGWGRAVPDDYQMRMIVNEVALGMEAGAVGLSTGLDYISQFFSTTDEFVEACAPLVAMQGLYVSHVRYKKGTLAGVKEAVEIGRRAGIPVHISHLKGTAAEPTEEIIRYIDEVAVNEVDFSFDVYPYMPGSTMLNYLLPYEVWENGPLGVLRHLTRRDIRKQFDQSLQLLPLDTTTIAWVAGKENSQHQGKTLREFIDERGTSAGDALADLLIEENLAVLLVLTAGDDDLINPFLSHPNYMMGSDGILHEPVDVPEHDDRRFRNIKDPDPVYFSMIAARQVSRHPEWHNTGSSIHPRQYGSAARVLGPCVRDKNLFSLEEAVYKLSGYPATRFGAKQRGELRENWFADIVVFDAETITDRASYLVPHQFSTGVEHVLVNGKMIIKEGQPVEDVLPGRALKFKN